MRALLPSSLLVPAALAALAAAPAAAAPALAPCRLDGVEHPAQCGSVRRALDPAAPQGVQIEVHYAVLPALARRKAPDPVFFFAGGPGQSAIELAGVLSKRYARLANRRDLVFVDQRGTGRSAPLKCADDDERAPARPLAEQLDEARRLQRLGACRQALQRLPHGDLRQYTTTIAMADVDAVRAALGAERIDLVGASYGTRAALEYQRLYPQRVRRAVLDGVAAPDMALPQAFAVDNQAALEAVFAGCEREPACRQRHPALRRQWRQLLDGLPREVSVSHPLTAADERLRLDRDAVLGLVRPPLYAPLLAAGLPAAIAAAAGGRFGPLLGLASAFGVAGGGLASGMHFSVICAEDVPRLDDVRPAAVGDFGDSFARSYRQVCADWPRGAVAADFYRLPPATAPTLLLSGGLDPATPPRHAERVARLLGAQARHVVVGNAGHGVLGLACLRDAVQRFITTEADDAALRLDLGCAAALPRPPAFAPIAAADREGSR